MDTGLQQAFPTSSDIEYWGRSLVWLCPFNIVSRSGPDQAWFVSGENWGVKPAQFVVCCTFVQAKQWAIDQAGGRLRGRLIEWAVCRRFPTEGKRRGRGGRSLE